MFGLPDQNENSAIKVFFTFFVWIFAIITVFRIIWIENHLRNIFCKFLIKVESTWMCKIKEKTPLLTLLYCGRTAAWTSAVIGKIYIDVIFLTLVTTETLFLFSGCFCSFSSFAFKMAYLDPVLTCIQKPTTNKTYAIGLCHFSLFFTLVSMTDTNVNGCWQWLS